MNTVTPTQNQTNPLKKFYRAEKIRVKLPSRGNFYKDGVVELSDDKEVGVLPMTAADELVLKNPDALITGEAIVKVLESCVPAIKQPRKLLSCDIDVLMIAIRRASYGDDSSLTIQCPKCKDTSDYRIDLDILLNSTEELESSYEVLLDSGLTVFLRPGTFDTVLRRQKTAFESIRAQRSIENSEMIDEKKIKLFSDAFEKLTRINYELIVDAISKIVFTNEQGVTDEVTNKEHISDFVKNIEKSEVDKIESALSDINKVGIAKTIPAACKKCENTWDARLEFNPVNFS